MSQIAIPTNPISKPKYRFAKIEVDCLYQAQSAFKRMEILCQIMHVERLEIWCNGEEYASYYSPDTEKLPDKLHWLK